MLNGLSVSGSSAEDVASQVTGVLSGIVPALTAAVAGVIVAGISAWVKTWFVSRDDRTRATEQLDLATKRTEFARTWLEANRAIAEDSTSPEHLRRQAKGELDAAYRDAQRGFDERTSAISDASYEQVVAQLKMLLLLRPGLRNSSRAIVVLFYACVLTLAAVLGIQESVSCVVADPIPVAEVGAASGEVETTDQTIAITTDESTGVTLSGVVFEVPRLEPGSESTTTTTTVAGEVTGSQVALGGITVTLTRLDGDGPDAVPLDDNGVTRTLEAATDEHGAYQFTGLGVGSYSVTAADERFQTRSVQVTIGAESTTVDLRLERRPAIPTCTDWKFVGSGWEWLVAVIAGIAVLRLVFGAWLNRRERRPAADPPDAPS